jgi:hypothetical protein
LAAPAAARMVMAVTMVRRSVVLHVLMIISFACPA